MRYYCMPRPALHVLTTHRPLPVQNELAVLEFIHALVETLDRYFENVCELDIMFNLEKAHFILDEMVVDGCVVETNKVNILKPIALMEKASEEKLFAR